MLTEQQKLSPDLAARVFDASKPLIFVGHDGPLGDLYRRDKILFSLPSLYDSMPRRLLAALRARRKTNTTGRCPMCDACVDIHQPGHIAHETFCEATDEPVKNMLLNWYRTNHRNLGRRLMEDPTRPS